MDTLLQKRVEEAKKRSQREVPVSIEEFSRLDIRTGKILSAEPIPKSTKLLKLQVDIGDERRQIVAGIAPFYDPADLIGVPVVVVANLAPAKIFGVESRGMLLAAGDRASLLMPRIEVPPGTKIR